MIAVENLIDSLKSSPAGIRVVGCRNSGKSYAAFELKRSLGRSAVLLDAAAVVRPELWSHSSYGETGPRAIRAQNPVSLEVDRVLEASDRQGELTWIVDNAELILAHADFTALEKLASQVASEHLQIVWVRNRFVDEESGWFARREQPLAACLPRTDLTPEHEGPNAEAKARFFYRDWDDSQQEQAANWLASWSGGLPGLMFRLKPETPDSPLPEKPPTRLTLLVAQMVAELGLHERPVRSQAISHIIRRRLPPQRFLSRAAAAEIGYLKAVGMVRERHNIAGQSPCNGLFWENVAQVASELTPPLPSISRDLALALTSLLERAELAQAVAHELTQTPSIDTLAIALSNTFDAPEQLVTDLALLLGQTLGRIGTRRVLRTAGYTWTEESSPAELGQQIIRAARSTLQ